MLSAAAEHRLWTVFLMVLFQGEKKGLQISKFYKQQKCFAGTKLVHK